MSSDPQSTARYYLKTLSRMYGGREASNEAIAELLRLAPAARHAAGEVLAREGEPADRAFFVVEGRLRASLRSGAGERTLNEAIPGEVMGEAAIFLTGGRRMATLSAVDASTVVSMSRELFRASAGNAALIAVEQHLLRMLVSRIANTDALVARAWREADAGRRSLRDGLAGLLGGGR